MSIRLPFTAKPSSTALHTIVRDEITLSHPRLLFANALGRLWPHGTGARSRAAIYRLFGIQVGKGTLFHGPVTFRCGRDRAAQIVFGKYCFINSPLDIDATGPVEVGTGVSIGHHVSIITTGHEIGTAQRRAGELKIAPVTIKNGAWIGAGATLLPGVTIGEGAVVAAGAVVAKDVPANTLAGGVPARFLRELPAG